MEVTINNSPVHSTAKISQPFGPSPISYTCGFHTGVDIIPTGITENNPLLYSCVTGEVVFISNDSNNSLGVRAYILDNSGKYWRYCHMIVNSLQVNVGDIVTTESVIGRMGATGNVTGRHLHLECSTSYAWNCNTFLNPCEILEIPNIDDLIINFSGTVVPPEPPDLGPSPIPKPHAKNNFQNYFYKKYNINLT